MTDYDEVGVMQDDEQSRCGGPSQMVNYDGVGTKSGGGL